MHLFQIWEHISAESNASWRNLFTETHVVDLVRTSATEHRGILDRTYSDLACIHNWTWAWINTHRIFFPQNPQSLQPRTVDRTYKLRSVLNPQYKHLADNPCRLFCHWVMRCLSPSFTACPSACAWNLHMPVHVSYTSSSCLLPSLCSSRRL